MLIKKLKFSHDYDKLPLQWKKTKAVLIGVFRVTMGWLQQMPAFLRYDTKIRRKEEFYHLDNLSSGEWLILSFIHIDSGKPFTTIRRAYPAKEAYYMSSLGETFILEESR